MNIINAIDDPNVFAAHFRGTSWQAWRVFLMSLFALPMSEEELATYRAHTGRSAPPVSPSHEAWLVCGRRSGKSFILALIAVFLACFFDWRPFLRSGECGTIMVIAADRRQARVILRYVLGLLRSIPMLKRQIENSTTENVTLKRQVVIEVHTASFRTTRGYTIVAALLDELAFWPSDENAAQPDTEVIAAVRPGMATIPDAMLLCASSPYARRGALWEAYRKHYATDGDPILVWQAATREMNPSVPQSYIDQQMNDDPARSAAEYLAQFRTDIETFVSREAAEACITKNTRYRPPQPGIAYLGFVDPSGGSIDSFTAAVSHVDYSRETVVVDATREIRAPLSPELAVSELAMLFKSYGVSIITGDRYAGEWPREQFQKFGIVYRPAEKSKSELYVDFLPLVNSRRADLLDEPRLINQLLALERRTARGGRDSIDHPPGGHDDLINAVAGAASLALTRGTYNLSALADKGPDDDDPLGVEHWRRMRRNYYLLSGGQLQLW